MLRLKLGSPETKPSARGLRSAAGLPPKALRYQRENELGVAKPSNADTSASERLRSPT